MDSRLIVFLGLSMALSEPEFMCVHEIHVHEIHVHEIHVHETSTLRQFTRAKQTKKAIKCQTKCQTDGGGSGVAGRAPPVRPA